MYYYIIYVLLSNYIIDIFIGTCKNMCRSVYDSIYYKYIKDFSIENIKLRQNHVIRFFYGKYKT